MILQVAEQRNLKFNFAKCQFYQTQLEFFGYIFSADGISRSAKKVQAIKDAAVPKNASEVRSFLGMVQYCGRFIPKLADISAPLRALTHKDAKWTWSPRQKQAFENLTHVLTTETTMAYFDSYTLMLLLSDLVPF